MQKSKGFLWVAVSFSAFPVGISAQSELIPPEAIERSKKLLVPLDETFRVVAFPDGMAPEFRADDSATCGDCIEDFPGMGRLDFDFTFYGDATVNFIHIDSNGLITLDFGCGDCHPASLPVVVYRPASEIIAPFWADADTSDPASGLVYFKSEPHRYTVIWDNVGYSVGHADLGNTFEVVLTDGSDATVGVGNNVAFSYGDMGWTNGDHSDPETGGTPTPAPFGGEPAVVGVDAGDGTNFILLGSFDHEGKDFGGPFGAPGGVSFLDDTSVAFSVAQATGTIAGTVYGDLNGDCAQNLGEEGLAGWTVKLSPGDRATVTDAGGLFFFSFLPPGSYTVTEVARPNWTGGCASRSPVVTLAEGETVVDMSFGHQKLGSVKDLRVHLAAEVAVPGFQSRHGIRFQNVGNETVDGARVELQLPPGTEHWICDHSCNFFPSSNIVSWDLGRLSPGSFGWVNEAILIPAEASVGTVITATASIFPVVGDDTPEDNVFPLTQELRGSYDPNEKLVTPEGEVPQDQVLSYLIDFQNVGNFYAHNIVIRDVLDPSLDIATVEPGGSSHPNVFTVDPVTREMVWRFEDINLPWKALDLDPVHPESTGFVMFTAKPLAGVTFGEVIENGAAIHFDFNAPVLTNVVASRIGRPPVADAGPDRTVVRGAAVELDGSGSSDPEMDPLSYAWRQVDGPSVSLSDAHAAKPTFTAPAADAELTFELVVNDGDLDSAPDTVAIHVILAVNRPPQANAGPDQTVLEGSLVTLDGSSSTDPDLDFMTFQWEQVSGPAVNLSSATAVRPTFTAPEVGPAGDSLELKLTVTDPSQASTSDLVTIDFLDRPSHEIASLEPAHFWIGLKNSDDIGTRFDLKAELYLAGTPVAAGEARCIQNVVRSPDRALDVMVPFQFVAGASRTFTAGQVLSLKVSTRIGTDGAGGFCSGHSNAIGLRLYYDAASRPSGFRAELTPAPMAPLYLHTSGSGASTVDFLDGESVLGAIPDQKDSAGVNFAGGNPWVPVGVWTMTLE